MTPTSHTPQPLVSVIIPCYNQSRYLADAINSLLLQTYQPIEIIVVNDGSPDDTNRVCESFGNCITYLEQENQGRSAARNAGVAASKGEWLQFLDADDLLAPKKIEWQMADLLQADAGIGYCCTVYFDSAPFTQPNHCQYVGQIDNMLVGLCSLWLGTPLPIHSVLMRRELFSQVGGFEAGAEMDEDRWFFAKIAMSGAHYHFTPVAGAYYRQHHESTNSNRIGMLSSNFSFLQSIWNLVLQDKEMSNSLQPVMELSIISLARSIVKSGGRLSDVQPVFDFADLFNGMGPKWQQLRNFLPDRMTNWLWFLCQRALHRRFIG